MKVSSRTTRPVLARDDADLRLAAADRYVGIPLGLAGREIPDPGAVAGCPAAAVAAAQRILGGARDPIDLAGDVALDEDGAADRSRWKLIGADVQSLHPADLDAR